MTTYNELLRKAGIDDFPPGTELPPLTASGANLLNKRQSGGIGFPAGQVLRRSNERRDKITRVCLERNIKTPRGVVACKVEVGVDMDIF